MSIDVEPFTPDQWRIIHYLNFKMECLADQENIGLAIDKEKILGYIETLTNQKDPILASLKEAMPKVPIYRVKSKPKVTHKKDGTLSKHGEEWYRLLRQNKLPINYDGDLQIKTGEEEEANPGSSTQVVAQPFFELLCLLLLSLRLFRTLFIVTGKPDFIVLTFTNIL